MIGNVKIMMLKGEKGDQGEAGSGVYDDTEVRGLIASETQNRSDADAALDARVGILAGDIATIETSPSTASHSVGELLVYNDQLYIVTSAIASGESLVVDTNIEATSIGENIADIKGDISELNSSLTNYIVANSYTFPSAVSIGANNTYTNTDVDISSAVPAGYTPVFAYCRATGENSISCYQCGMYDVANKKAVIQLRNISASSLNVTPVITVVSVKS